MRSLFWDSENKINSKYCKYYSKGTNVGNTGVLKQTTTKKEKKRKKR